MIFTVFFIPWFKKRRCFPFKGQYNILLYTHLYLLLSLYIYLNIMGQNVYICIDVNGDALYTLQNTHNVPDRGSNMVCNIYGKHYGDVLYGTICVQHQIRYVVWVILLIITHINVSMTYTDLFQCMAKRFYTLRPTSRGKWLYWF